MNVAFEAVTSTEVDLGVLADIGAKTDPESWDVRSRQAASVKGVEGDTRDPHTVYEGALRYHSSESSTQQQELPGDIERDLENLFADAKECVFEDGIESDFSKRLLFMIERHNDAAMVTTAHLIAYEKVNPEVASEALRWLGRLNHPSSYPFRLWLLEKSLSASSSRMRDGAVLGLGSLDDPHALPFLEEAIRREPVHELRADMEQLLEQLENTNRCRSS